MILTLHRLALGRTRGASLTALGFALVSLGSPSLARASCDGPEATIRFSYPDESTPSIPPDAVFWAVAHAGSVSVEVDGVPLTSRGSVDVERHQFVAAAPLAEGEHDLVILVVPSSDGVGGSIGDERRVRFRVAAQAAPDALVSVDSVTLYPLAWNNRTGNLLNPPDAEYDTECSEHATRLEWSCDDLIPSHLARVGYAGEGDAIAYLVQGDTLVPAGCAAFWTQGSPESDPATFRVAAVSPNGVAEENAFAGSVELRTAQDTYSDRFSSSEGCSLGSGPRSPLPFGAAVAMAVAAWCARRRR